MMKIEFSTSNAAFCNPISGEEDHLYFRQECFRVLDNIKDQIFMSHTNGLIQDLNGNPIGEWSI